MKNSTEKKFKNKRLKDKDVKKFGVKDGLRLDRRDVVGRGSCIGY